MENKTKNKRRKDSVQLEKMTKSRKVKSEGGDINNHYFSIRPDYFARYRYELDELIDLLKKSSGQLYSTHSFIFQILDDLGHWSFVRQSPVFQFTAELEETIRSQFSMLQNISRYKTSDILLWGDISNSNSKRQFVQIEEKLTGEDFELYRVKSIESSATFLVSRYELDFWNASGSTLPVDHLVEVIDWDRDLFWIKKINNFKTLMVAKNFNFDFKADEASLASQRASLVEDIMKYFKLNNGDLLQTGRGLGMLSCGQGTKEMSTLVESMALQALGQVFGIQSRLWGSVNGFDTNPSFLVIDVKAEAKDFTLQTNIVKMVEELNFRPIQRTVNEVIRRVVAKGPFGLPESLNLLRSSAISPTEQIDSDIKFHQE